MKTSRFDSDLVKSMPVLVVFFLLLKAYVVARYSLTTTGALVSAAPFTVLVGTVTSYLNIALVLIGVGTAWWLVLRRKSQDRADRDLRPMAFGIASVCLLFFPLPVHGGLGRIFAFTVGVLVVACLSWWLLSTAARRHTGSAVLRFFAQRQVWGVVAFLVLLLPTLRTPWVPAEVLVLRDSIAISDSHPVDGQLRTTRYPVVYVLSQDGPWTTALDAKSRFLIRLPTTTILHRQVCHYADQPRSSIPLGAFLMGTRYASPNTVCHTLVARHAVLLDPLVVPSARTP